VARPGNASVALGSAVVLRMKNMDYLQAGLPAETLTARAA